MSMPSFDPTLKIERDDAINLLLASIAYEELGLAHVINAEAEKIQSIVGTLDNGKTISEAPTVSELVEIDDAVNDVLKTVIKKEMLLQFKLEEIENIPPETTTTTKE